MEKPKTAARMLDALWYAVFGMNEKDGMLTMVRQMWEERQAAPDLWTRADHFKERDENNSRTQKEREKNKERRKLGRESIWGLIIQAVLALGTIATVAIMLARMAGKH
jgi:hypothetical protein